MPKRLSLLAILAGIVCILASTTLAQEVRASVTGTVSDPSGAPVAGAQVVITSLERNTAVTSESNETGTYVTGFLPPGSYRLTVEKPGFRRFVRENIVLQAQDRPRIDVRLEIGELAQSVTVTEGVTLLQTETASRSQIIANELIANVPTQGRNPFQIAWAAPGVIKTGDWRYLRSFDIGGTSGISINGGRNKENEVLLDGISNVQSDRTVIHVPTMESVQEFKVLTNTYDAQYGRTGGGVVAIVTKSGGNSFRGNLFEYLQVEEFNANQSELNRGGVRKPPMNINTFGVQASGPVFVPRLFNGKNRLFWLVSYEGMRQRSADPGTANFPLMEWRGGDFTTLKNAQGSAVTVYDPLTTRADGSRLPFSSNRLPAARINRVAAEVLKFYPPPNSPGSGPAFVDNYVYPSRWVADMNQWIGRTDFVLDSRNTFYFRYGQNPFSEFRGLVWNGSNAAEPSGNAPLLRNGRNWTFDWTSTLSPRMTANLRAGLARWENSSGNVYGAGYDPRQLGFDPALVAQFTKFQFPNFNLGFYQAIGSNRLFNSGANDSYTLQPNLNMVLGRHVMKTGGELRRYNDNTQNPGLASGSYTFGRNWTQQIYNRADAVSGNELATFLLGYPSSAYVDRNIDPSYRNHYYSVYFQDDWKATSRLTLNLGLRWDYETPRVERFDRMVRGMDLRAPSPIAAQAKGLDLKGAILFAGQNGQPRASFEPDRNNIQPRVGAAYSLGRWVLRGGYGLSYLGQHANGSAMGYSQRTNAVTSTDGNLTPAVNLANAFVNLPGGRLLEAVGSSLGAASFLGEGVTVNYLDRELPYSHQYSFDVQRELPGGWLFEAGYAGNLTRKLPLSASLTYVPLNELNRRTPAGAIDNAYYTARVPNPMAGLIPNNASLNGATIPRVNLMSAYPQFSSVSLANIPIGRQRYDSLQVKASKRLSHGLTLLSSYTLSKSLEQVSLKNAQDFNLNTPAATPLEKLHASQLDTPHKFTLVGVYDFPFGRRKTLGGGWPRALELALGGWQANWNYTWQAGWVVDYPNAAQVRPGSAVLPSGERSYERWFNTSLWDDPATGRRVPPQEPYTLRDYPARFGDVRVPPYDNLDASLSKYFPLHEEIRLQFRFEMVNAFNHPWFSRLASGGNTVTNANFGRLDVVQRNLPRFIKLALNLSW